MQSLNSQLLRIIVEAMGVGLIISVFLSLLLAKTMIAPIQDLTARLRRSRAATSPARWTTSPRTR